MAVSGYMSRADVKRDTQPAARGAVEPERREVPELAAQLVLSIELLESAMAGLESRLSPVLSHDDGKVETDPVRLCSTDMGTCLQGAVTRVTSLTEAVRRLEQRAQL